MEQVIDRVRVSRRSWRLFTHRAANYNISLGIPVFNLQLRTGESDLLLGGIGSWRGLVADVDGVTHDLLMERGESSRVSDQCL